MENPHSLRRKVRSVIKVAICGALLFVMLQLAVIAGNHFWGHGSAGEFGPSTFLLLLFLVSVPSMALWRITGMEHTFLDGFAHTLAFGLLLNGLLGALIFSVVAAVWQFLLKGIHEN